MERIERLLKKANSLPLQSGVYIMKDKTKKVIYVGKAKKLKNRVTSYFRKNTSHNAKTIMMVSTYQNDFIHCVSNNIISLEVCRICSISVVILLAHNQKLCEYVKTILVCHNHLHSYYSGGNKT